MLQQQQHMAFSGYGSGPPRTPLQQNVGTPRLRGVMATPRIPAAIPTQTTTSRTPLVAAPMALPTGMTNEDVTSVLQQHSGKKQPSSLDAQDSYSPTADSRPTTFILDPPTVHRLPADMNETMGTSQLGDEELVPEGEYDYFSQAVLLSGVH